MSTTDPAGPVTISYYSDVLCVWAYVSQIRCDELRHQFGNKVSVHPRLCSVFADVKTKIIDGWKDRGGVPAFREHVQQVIARFDHVTLHPDTWTRTIPTTSSTVHACIAAVKLGTEGAADELTWQLRLAFFRDGRDVSRLDVQLAVAEDLGLSPTAIRARLDDGSAWAALQRAYDLAKAEQVRGSPTFLMNEGRQMLYGNVGYTTIEANVVELLLDPGDHASWC